MVSARNVNYVIKEADLIWRLSLWDSIVLDCVGPSGLCYDFKVAYSEWFFKLSSNKHETGCRISLGTI